MALQAAQADFLVANATCKDIDPPASLFKDFASAARRGSDELWVRKLGTR